MLPAGFQASTTWDKYVRIGKDHRLYVNWYNLWLKRSGYEVRLPKHDTRRAVEPKVRRFLQDGDPGLFVPVFSMGGNAGRLSTKWSTALLVENCLSAIVAAEACQKAGVQWMPLALGGSNLSKAQVRALVQHGYRKLVFMLDPDATDKAASLSQKVRSFFQTQVVVMQVKPKDLPQTALINHLTTNNPNNA